MRISTVVALLVLSLSVSAHASKKAGSSMPVMTGGHYGTAGCGLGSMLFGSQPGMIQIVAATFNGTAGNQTFGITSGTSNCKETAGANTAAVFIKANREALEKDLARGSGETIETLAQIYGCPDHSALGQTLKGQYRSVFPSGSVDSDQVTHSIESAIQSDKGLSQQCVQAG